MPGGAKKLRCPVCDFESNTLSGLKRHMLKHIESNTCPVCGRRFKKAIGLSIHLSWASAHDDVHLRFAYVISKHGSKARKNAAKHLLRS